MTKRLTSDAFDRARASVHEIGRPLEQARFAYHFEGAEARGATQALEAFQNPDGGFGNGLEPDMRAPASSVIATTVGLGVLEEVGAGPDEPAVTRAIAYLLQTFDADTGVWPIIPPEADESPRAWWWDYGDSAANFNGFKANPRADVISFLWRYRPQGNEGFLEDVTARTLADLQAMPDEMEQHDLRCLLRLVETPELPDRFRGPLSDKAERAVRATLNTDPSKWGEYGLLPLDVAPRPDSVMAAVVGRDLLDTHLDHLISTQGDDGAWKPAWSWEARFPETWPQAERDWSGVLTLNNLRTLSAFGRVSR